MVQWVKVLAAKLDDLSWVPGTYTGRREPSPTVILLPVIIHTHAMTNAHMHTCVCTPK